MIDNGSCRFWLCRLIGHNPIPTVREIVPNTIIVGYGNGPRRWSCGRTMIEIGYRE